MKRSSLFFVLLSIILLVLSSCGSAGNRDEASFNADVLENNQSSLLVQPVEGSRELSSADKIVVYINDDVKLVDSQGKEIEVSQIKAGDKVQVFYNGAIAESYPAQIHKCYKVKLMD
ncbi:hypothetical protein JOD02_000430 [Caldicoprobacter guelmensis]|uniref:DUF3221 domain-containing protein n=1 Tax=Caldicoprobacter guelmensis TaxID=1170224 RepID=UPI00195D2646|nr:DUF3221 domain-containing protein [Caldicoprobacter guelmensis]MBM7581607.1 hypothetical protein [Caldicoprobacter guelmensis]